MSISINNNNGIIEVSQNGAVPRSYFRTSGKFYPSGTSGAAIVVNPNINAEYNIVSNDTLDCVDNFYGTQIQGSTSGNGSGALFGIQILSGSIQSVSIDYVFGSNSGYAIGDTVTFYGTDYGGVGSCTIKIEALEIDGFLINLEKDTYNVKWYDLVINGTSPTSLSDAQSLLAAALAPTPPTPPINTSTLKVNPPSTNTFDIPAYKSGTSDGDFTIEWLQYMHTDDNFPRIYSIGQYPAQNAVSIEGGTFYLWLNGAITLAFPLSSLSYNYLNTWMHIVITRKNDILHVWFGIPSSCVGTNLTYSNAIPTNHLDLYIGSENAANTYYNGLISNFRWCTGDAIYGDTPPFYPIEPLNLKGSAILLIGQGTDLTSQLTDQTGINTITNTDCTYNANSGISGYNGSIQFGTI